MPATNFENLTEQIVQVKKQKVPYRRARSEKKNPLRTKLNNDGTPKGTGRYFMGYSWDGRAVYLPRRKKLKGYQKQR